MRFEENVLQVNETGRRPMLQVLEAALSAVDPAIAVERALRRRGADLRVGDQRYDLDAFRRILILGAGKAGTPMAQAAAAILGDRIAGGLVVVKTEHGGPCRHVEIVEAAHPVPDEAGVAAGERILALAESAGPDDLVITLLSGGGSALLVAPAAGISLRELQAMTDALLASGATINEINCLRKHCSRIKGGQLARAVQPATLITLVLSDVVGSPLDVIASGPTVADSSTWQDAWAIVQRYELAAKLPASIITRLKSGLAGQLPDTPKATDPAFDATRTLIIGDNRVAALAAAQAATDLGFNTRLLTTYLEGEAVQAARFAVALAREVRASGHPLAPPACLILGGETTVQLGAHPGRGGRNQTLALAAALALDALGDEAAGITIVSLATDGTDGPTDSAGALADGLTVRRGARAGLDAAAHLRADDAYPFLAATHDLLLTGPTQTNVNDLTFIFVDNPARL